jgi:hypothetical protein
MEKLNQLAISKVLGSTIRPVQSVGFGNFNLLSTTEELQDALKGDDQDQLVSEFGYKEDAKVVEAFEAVRSGAPTDELLWNKDLARAFVAGCKRLKLKAPQAYLIRRLLNVRKNAPRYKEHGIEIDPTTKKDVHPSIVPRYAHVIEFALVKLRFRYGASIDDILMDPRLGDRFEETAKQIVPTISSVNLRLGALYIRKNRGTKKKDFEEIRDLDVKEVENAWKGKQSLADVNLAFVPAGPGLIELREDRRYLYISHNEDIHAALSQLHTGDAFRLVANNFWQPKLDAITVLYAPGKKIGHTSIEKWERKLVYERDPVLNWPIPKKAA